MKSDRWTQQNVNLEAEAQVVAQRQVLARRKVAKLTRVLQVEAAAGVLLTGAMALVRVEAAVIAGVLAVVGFIVCLYFWTGARQRVKLNEGALASSKNEKRQWQRQKPRDMT